MSDLFCTNKTKKFFKPLSLVTSGLPQISKYQITAKPTFKQQRYADLDFFRQQIEESKAGLHHLPYTNRKKNTTTYKIIFFALAGLFLTLNFTIMAIPSALGCGFFFSSCSFLKGIIVTICSVLAVSSFGVALALRAEKEAVAFYVRKTKAHVAAIYTRKKMRMGIKSFLVFFGSDRQKAAMLRHMYHEVLDKINNKKDETLHLAHRIATAETLDNEEKEDLLNQAIEELNDKLQMLVHNFRHAKS